MYKVEYGDDIKNLKKDYLGLFSIDSLDARWKEQWKVLKKLDPANCAAFPKEIKQLLTAKYKDLVDIYLKYVAFDAAVDKTTSVYAALVAELKSIFDYNSHQPKIAEYFAKHFSISTCHYCDMTYINTYIDTSSGGTKRQFDLDHVLDKGKCPLIGLSLFNFVPSCSVCNSRAKHSATIGKGIKSKMLKLSPTNSCDYTFEEDVNIHLALSKDGDVNQFAMKQSDKVSIKFDTTANPVYQDEVDMFKLEDRYNYHKVYALRLWDLKKKYTDETFVKIAKLLSDDKTSVSPDTIKEDFFGTYFMTQYHRAFGKLHHDIMQQDGLII